MSLLELNAASLRNSQTNTKTQSCTPDVQAHCLLWVLLKFTNNFSQGRE